MKHHAALLASLLLAVAAPLAAADAAAPLAAADAAAPAATDAKPAYPLTACVVSGESLDSMGGPYVHIHKEEGKPDREVRLCCKGCLKKFSKDPAKYIGKLDASEKNPAPAPAADAGHAH